MSTPTALPPQAHTARTTLAYRALDAAASRLGHRNYLAQREAHLKQGLPMHTFRMVVTAGHQALCAAMPRLLAGEITPHEAMGLIRDHGVPLPARAPQPVAGEGTHT